MDTGELILTLTRCDKELIDLDQHIGSLQLALKDAKKAREEKVTELRGAIRDAARPIFQMLRDDAREETHA